MNTNATTYELVLLISNDYACYENQHDPVLYVQAVDKVVSKHMHKPYTTLNLLQAMTEAKQYWEED